MRSRFLLQILACTLVHASVAEAASRLTNVSVRSTAGSGAETLIVGFAIGGTGNKAMLVRGVGPALTPFGVTGAVTDPELRLYDQTNAMIAENDNWGGGATIAGASAGVGAFALPNSSADAVVLSMLSPGSYSAHVVAKTGTGTALVEAYDTDPSATSTARITNVSARSTAGTGAAVLTVGFAISGDTAKTLLIRAVGPTLGNFGVTAALANPQLRLFSSRNTTVGVNDDWYSTAGWAAAYAAVGAFPLPNSSRDAVLLVRLAPGTYTAQASGVNNTTGVALIEVYEVESPPAASFVLQPVDAAPRSDRVPPAGAGSTSPAVITQARPVYPFDLRRAGISGEALVDFIVDVDGRVINAFVLRATDVQFADAAIGAVRQWTFLPGLNAARQPVLFNLQVPIIFTLNEQ